MIANKPIRLVISFIHLAIAIFCLSFFIAFIISEVDWSLSAFYESRVFFLMLVLGILGTTSFIGYLSWQTLNSQVSKIVSYAVALCFLIMYFLLFAELKASDLMGVLVVTFTPAIFIFLLAFSKVGQTPIKNIEYQNDSLDSDFLASPNEEITKLPIFWKPNRIVSLSSCVFAILLFIFFLASRAPSWSIAAPCIFLIGSAVLWIFPKIGSWIFAITSGLAGIGVVAGFIFTITTLSLNASGNKKIYLILFLSILVFSISLLCISLAMLLLSKEAKEEWKDKLENQ